MRNLHTFITMILYGKYSKTSFLPFHFNLSIDSPIFTTLFIVQLAGIAQIAAHYPCVFPLISISLGSRGLLDS